MGANIKVLIERGELFVEKQPIPHLMLEHQIAIRNTSRVERIFPTSNGILIRERFLLGSCYELLLLSSWRVAADYLDSRGRRRCRLARASLTADAANTQLGAEDALSWALFDQVNELLEVETNSDRELWREVFVFELRDLCYFMIILVYFNYC